ncbi:unnamed protein product [Gemmataceae bacterium]|nr:unnamed protein product [Gemmataceae bacterium]VTU01869.1 unnamed protein product [Gemmataceae bacterium]
MAQIAIMVIDPGGNRFAQAIDNYAQVRHAIPVFVNRLGLPEQLTYQLIPVGTRSPLLVDKTLVANGVRPGAELRLQPIRDTLFAAVTKKLYEEARDYAAKKLWELARERLEQLFRTYPEQPDPAGLLQIVPGYAGGAAAPTAATAVSGAAAGGAAPPVPVPGPAAAGVEAAGGSGFGVGCLIVILLGAGAAAFNNQNEIERWWNKNKPEWARNAAKQQPGKDARAAKPAPDANSKEVYGVFLVGPGEEVICGRRSVIEGTPKGNLHGWGLDHVTTVGQSGVELRMIRGPFDTAEETRRAYEADLLPETVRDMGIANHTRARFRFDNKEHMIDNATRLLR